MFFQVGEYFELFTTRLTFPRIGVMLDDLMIVVGSITTKLLVAQIATVVHRILVMTQ